MVCLSGCFQSWYPPVGSSTESGKSRSGTPNNWAVSYNGSYDLFTRNGSLSHRKQSHPHRHINSIWKVIMFFFEKCCMVCSQKCQFFFQMFFSSERHLTCRSWAVSPPMRSACVRRLGGEAVRLCGFSPWVEGGEVSHLDPGFRKDFLGGILGVRVFFLVLDECQKWKHLKVG